MSKLEENKGQYSPQLELMTHQAKGRQECDGKAMVQDFYRTAFGKRKKAVTGLLQLKKKKKTCHRAEGLLTAR